MRGRLNVPLTIGVGGSFDFIAGVVARAPRWMQRLGLEWFYRLLIQPERWRRMRVLPGFVLLVLKQSFTGDGREMKSFGIRRHIAAGNTGEEDRRQVS